jgi:thioesterase domain-containing protein
LFLVHPGLGEILVFLRLASVLDDDRPVYAIRARGFDHGETPHQSIAQMSQEYVPAIEKVYPDGPYNIAGYSFGAAVAFEMGKELEAKGKKVSFFGALNLPPHIRWR